MADNGLMMQYFEWYLKSDQSLWKKVAGEAPKLAKLGITSLWLPPAYKGARGKDDVGYGAYDLYDLGEFNQKGSVATKYGTKKEYIDAIKALHDVNIDAYADIVLNHKIGADEVEEVKADEFNATDRNQMISEGKTIGAWTKFTFPGRKGKYSDFTWNWTHFDGIDWDENSLSSAVYKFEGKDWDDEVDRSEYGNYDFLMGADIDFGNQEVFEELVKWAVWYVKTCGIDGLRLDAVKHIPAHFYRDFLYRVRQEVGSELFTVGEYWHWDVNVLSNYLSEIKGEASLFDVPLHFNFHNCSKAHGSYDMRNLLDGSLVKVNPVKAVTFVDNHDTQPGQSLESWVEEWFKLHAYSFILLRAEGYPCVFYGDYYGISHDKIRSGRKELDKLMKIRLTKAYGEQHDYFDDPNCIGWTREGDAEHKNSGLAVVMSDGAGGTKHMYIGKQFAGRHFRDALGNAKYDIMIDDTGCGDFYVNRDEVSVWVLKTAKTEA